MCSEEHRTLESLIPPEPLWGSLLVIASTLLHGEITQDAGGILPRWTRCQPSHARRCAAVRACVCTRTRLWAVCPPQFFASSSVACGLSAWGGQHKDFKRPLGLLDFLRFLKIVGSNWVQIPANLVHGSSPRAPAYVGFASGYCKQEFCYTLA